MVGSMQRRLDVGNQNGSQYLTGIFKNPRASAITSILHWSKKYPICIALKRDQLTFQYPAVAVPTISHKDAEKKEELEEAQIYSMLASELEDQVELVTETYLDPMFLPEENIGLLQYTDSRTNMKLVDEEEEDDRCSKIYSSWHDITQDSPDTTYLYLFGRTGREKEDWFRRLKYAINELPSSQSGETKGEVQFKDNRSSASLSAEENQLSKNLLEQEYLTYMNKMSDVISFCDDSTTNKRFFREDVKDVISVLPTEGEIRDHQWINTLIARVFFDALKEPLLIQRIKDRIQRKLTSLRLPYFINELVCEELNLGNTSPCIGQSYRPIVDSRGLWIDLDVSYEGLVVVILQTKLDLLKLKQPRRSSEENFDQEKSAIFHSDVDDSAESTTDEDCGNKVAINRTSALDTTAQPKHPLGGMSNKSKKFMKMVTGLTESKFFQAAAEMKYIKRAMEEVSNTDLRLKVEFKKCSGTLVLNIPPPPSDRIWFGFRFPPELIISAHPIVGERSISMHQVTRWIEKRIYKEFQKVLVLPNMEDIAVPVMSSKSLD